MAPWVERRGFRHAPLPGVASRAVLYDDGLIACDNSSLVIKRYYPWGSTKKNPYASIRSVSEIQMTRLTGKWRIFGSGDLRHWWNLDTKRLNKQVAFVIDTGARVLPTITPDDPDSFRRALSERSTQ